MSIATVITRGYGSFGDIAHVVTRGYDIAEATDVPAPTWDRTLYLQAESRALRLPYETRTLILPADNRTRR